MTTSLTGVILSIFPEEKYGDFRKIVFWIQELNVQHPNTWSVELYHADRLAIQGFKNNDVVEVQVQILGKLLNKKIGNEQFVINILKCTGIKKV